MLRHYTWRFALATRSENPHIFKRSKNTLNDTYFQVFHSYMVADIHIKYFQILLFIHLLHFALYLYFNYWMYNEVFADLKYIT